MVFSKWCQVLCSTLTWLKLVPKGWGVVGIRQHEASARIGNPAVEGRRLVYPLGVVEPLRSKKVA